MTDTYPSPVSQGCCHSDGVPCLPISGGGGLARLLIAVKWPLSRPCCWTSSCRRHRSELIAACRSWGPLRPPPTRAYLFRAFSHVNQAMQYLAGHAGQARRSRWRDRDSPGGWLKVFHSLVAVVFLMPPLIDRLMSVWWRSEDPVGRERERERAGYNKLMCEGPAMNIFQEICGKTRVCWSSRTHSCEFLLSSFWWIRTQQNVNAKNCFCCWLFIVV